jgi:hypothetical protein
MIMVPNTAPPAPVNVRQASKPGAGIVIRSERDREQVSVVAVTVQEEAVTGTLIPDAQLLAKARGANKSMRKTIFLNGVEPILSIGTSEPDPADRLSLQALNLLVTLFPHPWQQVICLAPQMILYSSTTMTKMQMMMTSMATI